MQRRAVPVAAVGSTGGARRKKTIVDVGPFGARGPVQTMNLDFVTLSDV